MGASDETVQALAAAAAVGERAEAALTATHWSALDTLSNKMSEDGAICALIGPEGAGLDAVANRFAGAPPAGLQVVRLDGEGLTGVGVVETLADAVGAREAASEAEGVAEALSLRLGQLASRGASVAAMVTRAEALSPDALCLLASLAEERDADETDARADDGAEAAPVGRIRVALLGDERLSQKLAALSSPALRAASESARRLRFVTRDEIRALAKQSLRELKTEIELEAIDAAFAATRGAPELLGPMLAAMRAYAEEIATPSYGAKRIDEATVADLAEAMDLASRASGFAEAAGETDDQGRGADDFAEMGEAEFSPVSRAVSQPRKAAPAAESAPAPVAASLVVGDKLDPKDVDAETDRGAAARLRRGARRRAQRLAGVGVAAALMGGVGVWALADALSRVEVAAPLSYLAKPSAAASSLAGAEVAGAKIMGAPMHAPIDTADTGAASEGGAVAIEAVDDPAVEDPAILAERKQAKVKSLLRIAEARFSAEQYTRPKGRSAYAALLAAHRVDPGSPDVAERFDRLISIYEAEARQALQDRRFDSFHRLNGVAERIRARRPI